jgi:hypothetical protein
MSTKKTSKPAVKIQDLKPSKTVKGGKATHSTSGGKHSLN